MATLFMQRNGALTVNGSIERSGLPILMNESKEDLESLMILIGSLDRCGTGKYHLNRSQVGDLDPYNGSGFNFGDLTFVQFYCEQKLDLIKERRVSNENWDAAIEDGYDPFNGF